MTEITSRISQIAVRKCLEGVFVTRHEAIRVLSNYSVKNKKTARGVRKISLAPIKMTRSKMKLAKSRNHGVHGAPST